MTFARGARKKNLLDIPHLAIPYLFRAFPRDYMTFSEMEENPALSLPGNFAVACPPSRAHKTISWLRATRTYGHAYLRTTFFPSAEGKRGGGKVEERPHPRVGM